MRYRNAALCTALLALFCALARCDDRADPHWRVGQWGHLGRTTPPDNQGLGSMSSWAHREMHDAGDGAERSLSERLAEPSPLTDSGVPPIVVHIPMHDEEQADYERLLKSEEARRFQRPEAGSASPAFEDIPASEHPLPRQYVERVKRVAAECGFEWKGLAVPNVFPDRHLFHAKPEEVQRALLEHHQKEGRSAEDIFAGDLMPPPRHHDEFTRSDRDVSTELATHTYASATDPPLDGAVPPKSFARLMAERNKHHMRQRQWKARWQEWRDGHHGDKVKAKARKALGESLEQLLAGNTAIREAVPQKPQARVLRVGRMPTMWQQYREAHDVDDRKDTRAARDFSRGPAVGDPMLTEQWSMYDAELWGDVPAGPVAHRPSISAGPQVWEGLGIDGAGVVIGVVDSGIELSHPELVHRYVRAPSVDALNPDRARPPTPIDSWREIHGTAAAGVALAERGNGVCGAGVAPGASLGAIRLLGLRSPTDTEEASALSHACRPHGSDPAHNQLINSVYSNSWGPVDDGAGLRGPGAMTAAALDACVHHHGRHGKGSIYVWAGGNGRAAGDNANFDGYANRPETIAVGAVDDTGSQAWYSEPGACLMLVAPSSGGSSGVVTADASGPMGYSVGRCTRVFGGTSAAAPAVAGIVALMLQVAPDLGWRDVQHVLVRSCERIADHDKREPWTRNAAGLWHSHGYGFGLINATRAVLEASAWRALEPTDALVANSPVLTAATTLYQDVVGERALEDAPVDIYDDDDGGEVPSGTARHARRDTAGAYPRFGKVYDADSGVDEPLTNAEEADVTKKRAERAEGVLKSMLLVGPRYAWGKWRQLRDAVVELARDEREARREARRARAPNRVRVDEARSGVSVAIPPGHTAEFRWHWPAPTGEADDPYGLRSIEHVGLRVDMRTPAGRGMVRIWLCAPSGTCSLMAPAPHEQDAGASIPGRAWTYWSVRNWGEAPIYGEDRSGHGRGTWGLMLTHTESPDDRQRHKTAKDRRYHPDRVDAHLNWWQIEVRGTRDPAPAVVPFA